MNLLLPEHAFAATALPNGSTVEMVVPLVQWA